jgi:hypothetical protein
VALAILSTGLVHLPVHWSPGLWRGAAGGLAYALAKFLIDYQDGFPEGGPGGLYLVQVAVRVILGAIVGAATLALGDSAAFVAGLAGPAAGSSSTIAERDWAEARAASCEQPSC